MPAKNQPCTSPMFQHLHLKTMMEDDPSEQQSLWRMIELQTASQTTASPLFEKKDELVHRLKKCEQELHTIKTAIQARLGTNEKQNMLQRDHELRSLLVSGLERLKELHVEESQLVKAILCKKASDQHGLAENRKVRRLLWVREDGFLTSGDLAPTELVENYRTSHCKIENFSST